MCWKIEIEKESALGYSHVRNQHLRLPPRHQQWFSSMDESKLFHELEDDRWRYNQSRPRTWSQGRHSMNGPTLWWGSKHIESGECRHYCKPKWVWPSKKGPFAVDHHGARAGAAQWSISGGTAQPSKSVTVEELHLQWQRQMDSALIDQ